MARNDANAHNSLRYQVTEICERKYALVTRTGPVAIFSFASVSP